MTLPKLGKLAQATLTNLVDKRFKKEFKLEEEATMAICAATSHPRYKAQWGTEEDSDKVIIIFKNVYKEKLKNLDKLLLPVSHFPVMPARNSFN